MARKRILVVDDDETLCQGLAFILKDEGYLVKSTSDPAKARLLADQFSHDIAILDYKMSGLTGIDLLRSIKERNPQTVVFIISGRPFLERTLAEEQVAHLVAGVLAKPLTERDLLAMIAKVK